MISDGELLGLGEDSATGVPFLATGQSPYFLQFRRMLWELLRACEGTNTLRVYATDAGGLSIGIRAGSARIGGQLVQVEAIGSMAVAASATTSVWLDAGGVQSGVSGFPSDPATYLPMAVVVTDAEAVVSVTDRRAEAMFDVPSLGSMGLTATAGEVNQVLSGVDANVFASRLNLLCGGEQSDAAGLHLHTSHTQMVDGDAWFTLANGSFDPGAGVGVRLSLPFVLPFDTEVMTDGTNGYLVQSYGGVSYQLLGTTTLQHGFAGNVGASVSGVMMGVVPADGEVVDVVLSAGTNLESSVSGDGLTADVKVNGVSVAMAGSLPGLTSGAGSGFRSTAVSAGDGTAAVVKSDGSEVVSRGDVVTVDLVRTATGVVSQEAVDVGVLVVVRVGGPG